MEPDQCNAVTKEHVLLLVGERLGAFGKRALDQLLARLSHGRRLQRTRRALSHDFVEAALMRRAGWGVWIAYYLVGSYEEMPPNLIDELGRDRRWCQGNLMNARLMLTTGLHPSHRVVFMTGVMAYLSAPLWFLFLLLSTIQLGLHTLVAPEYFVQPYQLFPRWPEWRPELALGLAAGTAAMLFLPKLLSVLLVRRPQRDLYGGAARLVASVVAEIIASALLAPIRMLFHTRFVFLALLGRALHWKSPEREDAETSWSDAVRRHGLHTAIGLAWAFGLYWLNPSYLLWLVPVAGALALSIPLSVFTSRASLGARVRRAGLFLIPEESVSPTSATRRSRSFVSDSTKKSKWACSPVAACDSTMARNPANTRGTLSSPSRSRAGRRSGTHPPCSAHRGARRG